MDKVNKNSKVYITDDVHPLLIDGLTELGYVVDYEPKVSLPDVKKKIHLYEGIIINSKILMDKEMLDLAEKLTFIGRLGSGLEIIDLDYAHLKNIHVFRAPDGNSNAVGEHALGMLLALANNLFKGNREVKNFDWRREANRGFELEGKTIGIIGFGHTGSQFAAKLSGFDVKILAYDKYKQRLGDGFRYVYQIKKLETMVMQADVISFHVPLTSETYHYLDKKFLAQAKEGVIIINTSRGPVIHTEALIEGLASAKIAGACLDVFENEKPESYSKQEKKMYERLFSFDNVLVSPHVAGWTKESKRKLASIILNQVKLIR